MPRNTPPRPLGTVLTLLRIVQRWPQNELAAALGCAPTLVCDYEAGRKPLSRKRLDAIVAVLGLSPEAVDRSLAYLAGVRALSPPEGGPAVRGADNEAFIAGVAANAEAWARTWLTLDDQRRAQAARHDARFLWERLKPLTPAQRRAQVETSMDFRTWALCELICEKSLEAAADRADRALDLASLAVRIAELAPGLGEWRKRLQGYALAHLANARRVGGDLAAAEEVFTRAKRLWEAGAAASVSFLEEALFLGLEASLRREQRRLDESLALLEQALAAAKGNLRIRLLINRARVLERKEDFEGAIAALKEVIPILATDQEPRLRFAVLFNLSQNLLEAGRPVEAETLLPDLRQLIMLTETALNSVRLQWLEGRTCAYLGQRQKAITILARVRDDFTTRNIAYDAALVTLELAALLLEEDRSQAVRSLSRQIVWIFKSQGIHCEALASLRLFCETVEREALTLEMTRRMVTYLHRARHDPELRFEA